MEKQGETEGAQDSRKEKNPKAKANGKEAPMPKASASLRLTAAPPPSIAGGCYLIIGSCLTRHSTIPVQLARIDGDTK